MGWIALGGLTPPLEAVLTFIPGGPAEFVVLAFISQAVLALVVTPQRVRLVLVFLGASLVAGAART